MPTPAIDTSIHIGRVAGSGRHNIVVEDFGQVSRSQAAVDVLPGGRLLIRDLGSRNGTFVNGTRVGPMPVPFVWTDEIRFGSYVFNSSELYPLVQAILAQTPVPDLAGVGIPRVPQAPGPCDAPPPPQPPPFEPPGDEHVAPAALAYAGFWRRLAALLVDSVVFAVVMGLAGVAIAGFAASGGNLDAVYAASGVLQVVMIVLGWLYFAGMESSTSQGTLGKRALGLAVTDELGRRISFGRATGRHFAKFLSAIILYIGFVMAAFTGRKQALHDMLVGTLVIRRRPGT